MRAVVQRVSKAQVDVGNETTGQIGTGLVVLIAAGQGDTDVDVAFMVRKIAELRIFEDEAGKMNRSVEDVGGAILAVSQFTLFGDCRKGRRPSFTGAMEPVQAQKLYSLFCSQLQARGLKVETGRFQAMMQVSFVNHGPVTLILDSRQ
ncbi:MAG: D-tyrosyl-tRNA(Tyr) deacylase [Myxococcales bacterium]|nr:D-tyrosyl-tRNA(Tyr) deacylase [Myxococcales bacterium]